MTTDVIECERDRRESGSTNYNSLKEITPLNLSAHSLTSIRTHRHYCGHVCTVDGLTLFPLVTMGCKKKLDTASSWRDPHTQSIAHSDKAQTMPEIPQLREKISTRSPSSCDTTTWGEGPLVPVKTSSTVWSSPNYKNGPPIHSVSSLWTPSRTTVPSSLRPSEVPGMDFVLSCIFTI